MLRSKRADAFAKVPNELTEATIHGSLLSILSFSFIALVLFIEIWTFSGTPAVKHTVGLDVVPEGQMRVSMDISFPRLRCEHAIVRLKSAYSPLIMVKPMKLERYHLDEKGNQMRDPYIPTVKAKTSYPGCQIKGEITMERTAASFEVDPPAFFNKEMQRSEYDLTHTVNAFSFGDPISPQALKQLVRLGESPSTADTLFKTEYTSTERNVAVLHYIHVVPTVYKLGAFRRKPLKAFQAVHHQHTSEFPPDTPVTVRFIFDINPMSVVVDFDKTKHWYDFVTNCLAVVGGSFAVAKYFNQALSGLV